MEFGGGHVQNFAHCSGKHCTSTALEEHWQFAMPIYPGAVCCDPRIRS
jgi:hypothetical protein